MSRARARARVRVRVRIRVRVMVRIKGRVSGVPRARTINHIILNCTLYARALALLPKNAENSSRETESESDDMREVLVRVWVRVGFGVELG